MAGVDAGPERLDVLNKVIQHNMNPEPDEDMTGEIHVDSVGQRWPVYRKVLVIEGARPARDADGKVLYHLRADGSRHRPMMESFVVETKVVEFVKMPLGNGIVQRNFNFRPKGSEVQAQRLARENEQARGELERLLAAGGRSIADVVSAVKESLGVGPRPAEPVVESEDPLARYRHLRGQAAELGLEIEGTGKNGSVTLSDLEAAIAELVGGGGDPVPQPATTLKEPEREEVGAGAE